VTAENAFYCTACNKSIGARWTQICPHTDCGAFGTIAQGKPPKLDAWVGTGRPTLLREVPEADYERISTGTREFDRVLGGGIVTGSSVLISGDPGIGKSTLLLQVCIDLSIAAIVNAETKEDEKPLTILYVSAEETNSQIKGRAMRLSKESKNLFLYNESSVEEICKHILLIDPDVLVIDSIQTMQKRGVDGAAGSVTQVRECAIMLTGVCKARGIGAFFVAHINKDGVVAGPKTLEHLVDCVLEFHQEGSGELRSVRASKNRFGDTNEMALFRMTKDGLQSVENPSALLLEHHEDGRVGTSVALVATGPRPFAVEVQTLLGSPFGKSSRILTGISSARATQTMAVLHKRLGIDMLRECFVNVPGGLDEVKDPAVDLPLALALAASDKGVALPDSFVAFGEVGLAGEVRPVSYNPARVKSAFLMGFKTIVGPVLPDHEHEMIVAMARAHEAVMGPPKEGEPDMVERYHGVRNLREALQLVGLGADLPEPPTLTVRAEEARKLRLVKKNESEDRS
jgi:DNA repair protein RadA/Sms